MKHDKSITTRITSFTRNRNGCSFLMPDLASRIPAWTSFQYNSSLMQYFFASLLTGILKKSLQSRADLYFYTCQTFLLLDYNNTCFLTRMSSKLPRNLKPTIKRNEQVHNGDLSQHHKRPNWFQDFYLHLVEQNKIKVFKNNNSKGKQ